MNQSVNSIKTPLILFLILAVVIFIHSGTYNFKFKFVVYDYLYTSWLFNYDYGFMRRALPGEILSLLNLDNDYKTIRTISASIFFALFSLFSFFLIKSLRKIQVENIYLYAACIIFLSFTTSQWLLELGRFDQLIQIFQLVFLVIILKTRNLIFSFLSVVLFVVLSALIHEASLIIFMPTLILIFFLEFKNKWATALLSFLLIVAIVLMVKFGQISISQSDLIMSAYEENKQFDQYAVRTTILNLWENVLSSYYSFTDNRTYIPLIVGLIFLYPVFDFVKYVFYKKINFLILLPTLTPLGLSLVAFDYYRWIVLALFNIIILMFYLINTGKVNTAEIKEYLATNKKYFVIYGVICLILGPFGIVRLFPSFYNVNLGGFSSHNLPTQVLLKLNLAAPTEEQIFAVNTTNVGWRIETDLIQYENIKKAMKWYEAEAAKGNPEALNNLALMYTRGGDIGIDYSKALALLKSSSNLGNTYATNNIGVMYANGLGVNKDAKVALSYYLQAAKQGNPAAMYNLGISYSKGLNDLKKDKSAANIWFNKAAALEYGPAMSQLKD